MKTEKQIITIDNIDVESTAIYFAITEAKRITNIENHIKTKMTDEESKVWFIGWLCTSIVEENIDDLSHSYFEQLSEVLEESK